MLRRVLVLICFLLAVASAHAVTTSAEAAANAAAQAELDAAPRESNIPSYALAPAELATMRHLHAIRTSLHFASEAWAVLLPLLLLSLGMVRRFRHWVVTRFSHRWLQGYGFWGLVLLSLTLLQLPLEAYGQWLMRKYGMSVQGWGSWLGDQGKTFLISWSVGGLIVMLLFLFLTRFPRRWWLIFWAATIPMLVLGIFATPYVIDPLFNHFEPLTKTNPLLVQQLERVARRGNMDIPPERMFLMKASEKQTLLNAYVTGFGASKRVVVWDTSIAKASTDQILFIFGHESGHYVLNHIVRGLTVGAALLLVAFWLARYAFLWLIARFGAAWGVPTQDNWGALVVLMLVLSVFSIMSEPVNSTITRHMEHDADVYGQEAVHGIVSNPGEATRSAFVLLGQGGFSDPNPSPLLEFWTYDHPGIGRRAAFAAHYDPWKADAAPKYFSKP